MKVRIRKNDSKREDIIKIETHDLWHVDITLAKIIYPTLKELLKRSHGCFHVDTEDLPADGRFVAVHAGEADGLLQKRWKWVLEEMIWTFKSISKKGCTAYNDEQKAKIANGLRLFGKYYPFLWA